MQLERNYYFSLPHPLFHFPLSTLQLFLPPLLHLSSPPSAFLSSYSLVPLSPFSQTPATTITSHWSPGLLCQPASPMPLQSSRRPFSICSAHSDPPTFSRSLSSTPRPSVASLFSLLTSRLFPPWLLLMPCPHWRAWTWRREHMKLHNYKKLIEQGKVKQMLMANFGEYKVFWSLHISHMDFLHQQPTFPFLLPTPRVVDGPLEFPWANSGHITSWSEAKDRWGSSPH